MNAKQGQRGGLASAAEMNFERNWDSSEFCSKLVVLGVCIKSCRELHTLFHYSTYTSACIIMHICNTALQQTQTLFAKALSRVTQQAQWPAHGDVIGR